MKGGSHRPTAQGWRNLSEDNGETAGEVGGIVIPLKAGASLFIGDAVYLSDTDIVNKTKTAATNLALIGVVVGGENSYNSVVQDDDSIGVFVAAEEGEMVQVCILGVCKVVADAAVTLGDTVTPATATTAGRVKTGDVATDAGRLIGRALQTAAAEGDVIRVLVGVR